MEGRLGGRKGGLEVGKAGGWVTGREGREASRKDQKAVREAWEAEREGWEGGLGCMEAGLGVRKVGLEGWRACTTYLFFNPSPPVSYDSQSFVTVVSVDNHASILFRIKNTHGIQKKEAVAQRPL